MGSGVHDSVKAFQKMLLKKNGGQFWKDAYMHNNVLHTAWDNPFCMQHIAFTV